MASIPRASWTPWSAYRGLVGRKRVLATLFVAAGLPLGLFAGDMGVWRQGDAGDEDAAIEADAPPRETPNVLVAMHLDEPLVPDRTTVWTAAFQAAWDAMGDAVQKEWGLPTFDLGPPAKPEDVKALNAGRLTPGVVDPKDLTVIAGPATEETWSKVEGASDRDPREGAPPPRGSDLVAFARLRASVRYEVPFDVGRAPLRFGSTRTRVRCYGLRSQTDGDAAERRRAQVSVHTVDDPLADDNAGRCVVVLAGADGSRVVVSGRPARPTLREAWNEAASVIRSAPPERLDSLWIPRVSFSAGRSYDNLVGAPVVGRDRTFLLVARQDMSLTADERGADVDAEAMIVLGIGQTIDVSFERPFLLALLAPGSDTPYALAWFGSADGLTRWEESIGRPMTAAEVKKMAGHWILLTDATVEATLANWGSAQKGRKRGGVERERESLRSTMANWTFDLTVAPDAIATLTYGRTKSTKAYPPTVLVRDGARILLAARGASSDPAAEPVGEERRWFLSRDGDRLKVNEPGSGVVFILRRR